MTGGSRREIVDGFDPGVPVEEAWTPPSSWYVAPEAFELERRSTFRCNWQLVGRTDQLQRTGDYFTGELAGEPYVVVRESEAAISAYSNVCRHHAAAVACGSGRLERFTCPYHGWTYRLNGSLESAPRMGGVRDFDREHFSLPRLEVATLGPLVFLRWKSGWAFDQLDDLRERLESGGIEELRFVERRRYAVECNWKVYVDNYLDGGYHVPVLHEGLAAQLDLESYRTGLFSTYSIQSCPGAREAADARTDFAERVGERALYAWVHPATMINRYGPWMDVNVVVPQGPDRTEVVFDYYLDPAFDPEDGAFVGRSLDASDRVQDEDRWICEAVQRGLESASYDRGRYAPRIENAMHHFHRLLHADLLRALED